MNDNPEWTEETFRRSLRRDRRRRMMAGEFDSGRDISDLRAFLGMTQEQFALALRISVHTLRGWEQGRRRPDGPAVALLSLAARHPRLLLNDAGRTTGGAATANGSAKTAAREPAGSRVHRHGGGDQRTPLWAA